MTKEEYASKLRDPRWQKKRLEILQRDNWTCQLCGDKESTLIVHHRYYLPGKEPWDYPDDSLATLCEQCHEQEGDELPEALDRLARALRSKFWAMGVNNLAHLIEQMDNLQAVDYVTLSLALELVLLKPEYRKHIVDMALQKVPRLRSEMMRRQESVREGWLLPKTRRGSR